MHAAVESASPHRLIQMLLNGALAKLSAAKGHLARGDLAAKGEQVGTAISIISALQASLDHAAGGEIAANLDQLYDYMARRLIEGNRTNDPQVFDEVHRLLGEIKAGWDGIAAEAEVS